MNKKRRMLARIFGNFGIGFLSPLTASLTVQAVFDHIIIFEKALVMAAIGSVILTGIAVSYDLTRYGNERSE